MNRREFSLSILPSALLPWTELPKESEHHSRMDYSRNQCFVISRDGMEFIGLSLTKYEWTVRCQCKNSWNRFVSATFYGSDAREKSEQAARTYVIGSKDGWPALVSPEK